jgi:superfamily II DNA or RNA helicase
MLTVHARESFFLKKKDMPRGLRSALVQDHTLYFFAERACNDCEFKQDRLEAEAKIVPACEDCAGFLGGTILAQDIKVGSNTYLKVPIGTGANLKKRLAEYDVDYMVKRHHPEELMKRRIKFTGTYRGKYQAEAVQAIVKKKRGVLRSPPRSGKTVIAAAAICKLGYKTLIMASQREWLMGFMETFIGSDTQDPLTNCRKTQIGFAKTLADFQKYDICLVTVQTFYRGAGPKLLEKVRDMFPVLFIDEVHTSAASEYAKVVNSLNCKYIIGLSGTPERKDERDRIMRQLVGPDIYSAKVEQLRPKVVLTRTQHVKNTKGNQMWVRMVSGLEKDPKRLKLIAQWALKDVKDGHMVLIPFSQVTPIKALTKAINLMAGKNIARPFWGGLTGKTEYKGKMMRRRDAYIQAARDYKIKVLVGNIKLLSTGTNIPRASALYETTLSSNLPNAQQRFARILTPYENKPQPIIRIFLDDSAVRRKCLRNEYWGVLHKKFKPIISTRDQEILKDYFADRDKVSGPIHL